MASSSSSSRFSWRQFFARQGDGLIQLVSLFAIPIILISIVSARFHWIPDIVVSFRLHFAITFLLSALFLLLIFRRLRWSLLHLAAALVTGFPILPYLPIGKPTEVTTLPDKSIRLMTFNVLSWNDEYPKVADYIVTVDPDFVFILEMTPEWRKELEFELYDHYPHRYEEPRPDSFGIAFYSKHPWSEVHTRSFSELPSIEATIPIHGQELTVLGTHPMVPLGKDRSKMRNLHLQNMADHLSKNSDPPLVVAGDFNITPWSPGFTNFLRQTDLTDSAHGYGIRPTWYRYPNIVTALPIDHIFHSDDIEILRREIGPELGSDHRPITIDFTIKD